MMRRKFSPTPVTSLCHGTDAAANARETAETTFEQGGQGKDLPTLKVPSTSLDAGIGILSLFTDAGLGSSNGEVRRLIRGGGAKVNDTAISDEGLILTSSDLNSEGVIKISAGKKRHALIQPV
jgi:tyrosyl-tRNA synthetase